jgi:hypothetical protein
LVFTLRNAVTLLRMSGCDDSKTIRFLLKTRDVPCWSAIVADNATSQKKGRRARSWGFPFTPAMTYNAPTVTT